MECLAGFQVRLGAQLHCSTTTTLAFEIDSDGDTFSTFIFAFRKKKYSQNAILREWINEVVSKIAEHTMVNGKHVF